MMLYGHLPLVYERALRGHGKHNEMYGYSIYVLREQTLPKSACPRPGGAVGAGSCQARSCSGALEQERVLCPFHLQSSPIEGS
jgi:hypothetical protein